MFTDMALIGYDGSESLDVVVRSLKTAKTVSGVRVALVAKDGEDLATAKSDADGRARFPRPLLEGDGAERAKMVMAYGPGRPGGAGPGPLAGRSVQAGRRRPHRVRRTAGRFPPTSTAISMPTAASIARARPCT
jgi:hypothetical protein